MLDRRRFLALSLGSGSLVAVAPPLSASAATSPWRAASWTARAGERVVAVDSTGRRIALVVSGVRSEPAQSGTSGESFTVTFASRHEFAGGRYRLTAKNLVSTQAYLDAGEPGTARLVVNTTRPV